MTITKRLLAAAAALAVWGPALAQDTGIYVGGAVGQASFREACRDAESLANAPGGFHCISKEDTAYKAFAGWRFHRNFAAELTYADFGEAKAQGEVGGSGGPVVNTVTRVRAAGLSGLGIVPLGERLSVYGRLGLLQTRTNSKASGAATAEAEHSETELHVGIGGLFSLGRGWSLRAEFERVNDSKIDLSSLGVQYRF